MHMDTQSCESQILRNIILPIKINYIIYSQLIAFVTRNYVVYVNKCDI